EPSVGNVAAARENEAHLAAGGGAVGRSCTVGGADHAVAPGRRGDARFTVRQRGPVAAFGSRETFARVVVQQGHEVAAAFRKIETTGQIDIEDRRARGAVRRILAAGLDALEIV